MRRSAIPTRPLAAAVSALSVVGLAACSGSSSDGGSSGGSGEDSESASIVWSTWGTPEELGRFEEFNEQFMKRHPNIDVELQAVPSYGEYHDKLLTQLISGTAPDVFYLGDANIGKFVDSDVLASMDDFLDDPDSALGRDDIFAGLYGAAATDDAVYGVPNDSNPDVMWYDKAALQAAGIDEDPAELAANGEWTIDVFLDMMDDLRDADMIGAMFWNYWATHYGWVSAYGGTAYDDQGEFVLADDPAAIEALEMLGERFQDGSFVVADTMPEGAGADNAFITHQAGFFAQGRYTIGTVSQGGEQEQYDIAPWPSVDGQPRPVGVAASYMSINKDTEDLDAAWTFVEEFVSAEGQEFRLEGGGNAVPSVKGADDVVLDGYPEHAQTFLDLRDEGFANYAEEGRVPGLSDDVSSAMLDYYEGRATLDETLAAITDFVENAGESS